MKLTKSHKICLAVLGMALVGLAADRLFLSPDKAGPEQAQARPTPSPAARPAAQAFAHPPAAAPAVLTNLARRIEACAGGTCLDPGTVREAFVPAQSWLRTPKVSQSDPVQPTLGQKFLQKHRLVSTILSGTNGGGVVVNDRIIQVGQEIDGFRLVEVTGSSAAFQAGEERVELWLRPNEHGSE